MGVAEHVRAEIAHDAKRINDLREIVEKVAHFRSKDGGGSMEDCWAWAETVVPIYFGERFGDDMSKVGWELKNQGPQILAGWIYEIHSDKPNVLIRGGDGQYYEAIPLNQALCYRVQQGLITIPGPGPINPESLELMLGPVPYNRRDHVSDSEKKDAYPSLLPTTERRDTSQSQPPINMAADMFNVAKQMAAAQQARFALVVPQCELTGGRATQDTDYERGLVSLFKYRPNGPAQ